MCKKWALILPPHLIAMLPSYHPKKISLNLPLVNIMLCAVLQAQISPQEGDMIPQMITGVHSSFHVICMKYGMLNLKPVVKISDIYWGA